MFSTASLAVKLLHAHSVEEPKHPGSSEWNDENREPSRHAGAFYGLNGYAVKAGALGTLPPAKKSYRSQFRSCSGTVWRTDTHAHLTNIPE